MNTIRNIFFPSPDSSRFRKVILPFSIVGGLLVLFLLAAPPLWEYSNSPVFCGTTCHTMPPNFSTYLDSPHARVLCVDCHIGRDLLAVQFIRKTEHMRLIVDTLSGNYEYPIHASTMRPARETCERCHFPEKFSDDSLRVIKTFENNRDNEPLSIYLLMHTGGGSQREGLGRGIHWHIENPIRFIALDQRQQEIPWVAVELADGEVTTFNAVNSPIDTSNLEQYDIQTMDCITCHNRIAHLIDTPEKVVDNALDRGDIPRDIPFIRVRAVELLSETYPSNAAATRAFETLAAYYRDNYPEFYAEGQVQVEAAIALLNTVYSEISYPEQKLDWKTHPNNVGHDSSPGCFRCHDGQHFSEAGEVIRLECNLCHSIPQIVRPTDIEPAIPIATGLEPTSHLDSTWIARHHNVLDPTCANCHDTADPGGISDTSFCSNSGCHGNKWVYAGFDAPGLAAMLGNYQFEPEPLLEDFTGTPTYTVLEPLFVQQCAGCHGPVPSNELRVTNFADLMAGGINGPVIVPGDPEASRIVQVIADGHFAQFTSHQLDLLRQWIAAGVPEV
jgi:nitrate/TMAO reductase-like tetraheme cytochrome c subunit